MSQLRQSEGLSGDYRPRSCDTDLFPLKNDVCYCYSEGCCLEHEDTVDRGDPPPMYEV
jgi:hypothetical protein